MAHLIGPFRRPLIRPLSGTPLAGAALALVYLATPASAQDRRAPSFEASLKAYCPAKNLEFLKPDVLARTTDAFVGDLTAEQSKKVKDLARPGVEACSGSADDSCRTAAVLGAIRFEGLSGELARRFCSLPMQCEDWFVCSEVAAAPAPAPPAPESAPSPSPAPAPNTQAQANPGVPQEMPPDEDTTAAGPSQPLAPATHPPGPVAQLPRLPEPPPPPGPAPAPAAPEAAPVPEPPPMAREDAPPDGRSAVAGFYEALGRGDGIEAARFLIPEKRGRGHFSAAAMERFYGGLRRPLRLTEVRQVGPSTLRARYTFVTQAGAVCDGDAVVGVRPSREGTLIESIRALSGC